VSLRPVAVMALVLTAWTPAAAAASLTLDERQREEAIRVGQRSVTSEAFGEEWQVTNGAGETVTVITPFHRIALAARHAAFRNEPLKAQDQERMLADLKDKLMLAVELRGPREDFARHFTPRLLVDGREVQPSVAQNERTAIREDDGRFRARCVYWFPARELRGDARLVLVVKRAPGGEDVAKFDIDLSTMR